ncbi:MAG TPA: lipoprotein [Gammaproteobacteria bacterium]|nr:lipoprotein [Gammaproteobacteria bacterium]
MRLALLALLMLGLLAGCGQKGPLFLPRPEHPTPGQPTPVTPATPEPASVVLPQPVTLPPQ